MADQPTGRERVDRAIDLMWATFQEPPFWAAMELWTAARTDPDLRGGAARRGAAAAGGDPRRWPTASGARRSPRAPLYAELCELLFTSMRGVALVYAFEDRPAATDPHLALWKRLAARMLALDVERVDRPGATAGQHDAGHTRAGRGATVSVPIPVLQGRGMTMSDQLARHARTTPEATALRFDGTGRSYAELDERVTRLARALRRARASAPATGSPSWRSTAWRPGRPTSPACGSARSSSR